MPRYFINTANHIEVLDEEGTELRDLSALRKLVRHALIDILRDEGDITGVNEYTAKAYDEGGRLVMISRIEFNIYDQ